MPVELGRYIFDNGIASVPWLVPLAKILIGFAAIWLLKTYFGGARTTAERNMHSKVIIITGGTSGIGAAIVRDLATRGAQILLLTQHALDDPFLVDFILDMRDSTKNELITAEQVDLSSLHSIRQFATKWVDNAPPRRLDMIILCADTMTPKGSPIVLSQDGVESTFAINYLANFHLLSILSPALRAQPPDRDVRIMFGCCASYRGGRLPDQIPRPDVAKLGSKKKGKQLIAASPSQAYGSSKLATMTFAAAFQKHMASYKRPDKTPMNARVIMIDPGWTRTPGMRRYLTGRSLWGLAAYLLTWPLWWLVLKSPDMGAQTFLHAAMEAEYGSGEGGRLLKECLEVRVDRAEVRDEAAQKQLWELSEKAIELLEKEGAQSRAQAKKDDQERKQEELRQERVAENAQRKEGSRRTRKAATGAS